MADEDAQLVERVRAGDRSAFEALVAMYLPRACAVARAVLHDVAATDDVVQESFIKAYERLGQLADPSDFPAWLTVIVRNQAISHLRQAMRHPTVPLDAVPEPVDAVASSPDNEPLERLRQVLPRLKPEYREVLRLRYEAGLDHPALAATLGISLANLEKRLYRARLALLELMG